MNKTIISLEFMFDNETRTIQTKINTNLPKDIVVQTLKEFIKSYEKEN